MATKDLDALLERMPAIADAINAFTSEAVQTDAFAALIAAFEGKQHRVRTDHLTDRSEAADLSLDENDAGDRSGVSDAPSAPDPKAPAPKRRKSASNGKIDWAVVHSLDLTPPGKQSFAEFVALKQPKSNEDKYAVAVYYLENELQLPNVTKNEIGTIFRMTKDWREPTAVVKGLKMTSLRKATIDASNADDLKITPRGRNFVEYELPPRAKAKV